MFDVKLITNFDNGARYYDKEINYKLKGLPETEEEIVELFEDVERKEKGRLMNIAISFETIDWAVDMGYAEYNEDEELVILDNKYNWLELNINRKEYKTALENTTDYTIDDSAFED